eukprot:gene2180-34390_t
MVAAAARHLSSPTGAAAEIASCCCRRSSFINPACAAVSAARSAAALPAMETQRPRATCEKKGRHPVASDVVAMEVVANIIATVWEYAAATMPDVDGTAGSRVAAEDGMDKNNAGDSEGSSNTAAVEVGVGGLRHGNDTGKYSSKDHDDYYYDYT